MTRAKGGDGRAFEMLAEADHPRLFRVAYGILRDRHLAEDATQQALLDIWRHIPRLRDAARFEAWSYRLLVNACYDEAKRRPAWVPTDELSPGDLPVSRDAAGPVVARDQLGRALGRLSLEHRAVFLRPLKSSASPNQLSSPWPSDRPTVRACPRRVTSSMG